MTEEEYIEAAGTKCPNCESEDIEGGPVEVDAGGAWQPITCNKCAAEWNDIYKLIGIGELNLADDKEGS